MTTYAIIENSKRTDGSRLLTPECFVGKVEAASRQAARRLVPPGHTIMLASSLRRWELTAFNASVERQRGTEEDADE